MRRSITSPANARVKDVVRLRDRKGRARQSRFLIDGAREILRAVEADYAILELFVCPACCRSPDAQHIANTAEQLAAEVFEVPQSVFHRIAFGERNEGVVAVAAMKNLPLADVRLGGRPLVLVLEGVEKPGNLGAMLRSADACGASAVLLADARTDLFNPNAIRASLGAVFTLPISEGTSAAVRTFLNDRRIPAYAARVNGSVDYAAIDFTGPAALVLGSEAHGLSAEWEQAASVAIPMAGTIDSLNVSVAAAVLMFEAARQRRLRAAKP